MFFIKKFIYKMNSSFVVSSLIKLVRSSYFIYVLGEIVSKSIDFFAIIYISRLISPSDYGYISIAYSLIPIFLAIYTINIPSALIRRYYDDLDDYSEFLMSNIVFISANGFIFVLIIILFSNQISLALNLPTNLLKVTAIVAYFKAYYEFFRCYLQAVRKSKKYSIVTFLYTLVLNTLLIFFLFNMANNQYMSKPYADLLTSFGFSIYIMFFFLNTMKWKPKIEHIKYAVFFGAPLIIQILANVILGQIDRLMINSLIGSTETGLYSFAYNLGMIMNIVVLGINKGWIPIFYANIVNTKMLEDKLKNITEFIFLLAAFLITYANIIIKFFIKESYYDSMSIFPVIVISFLFVYIYIIYSNYSFYHKKTIKVSINAIIVGIINIILNYYLIRLYGYKIAATTTLLSYMILCIMHYYTAKKVAKDNIISIGIFFRISIYFSFYILAINFVNKLINQDLIALAVNSFLLFAFIFMFKYRKK